MMKLLIFNFSSLPMLNPTARAEFPGAHFQLCRQQKKLGVRFSICRPSRSKRYCYSTSPNGNGDGIGGDEGQTENVQELRVPTHWMEPSKASEESEWLRVTLKKWLDDEYCPEDTNIEISKVAAHSYYRSLTEKRADVGEILLKMAAELESISYQESFHGAFSSANAAVSLIVERIMHE